MKRLCSLFAVFLILPSNAATVNLLPVADGQVVDGGALGFSVDSTATTVRTRSSGRDTRGVYEFDLSTIPSLATIVSVDLVLTLASSITNTASNAPVEFYSITGDGAITVADFDSPGILQNTEIYTLPVSIGTTLTISMTDLTPFQNVVSTNNEIGIRLDTVNFVTFLTHSSEAAVSPDLMPTLQVTFVPEPSAALLLLIATVSVTWRRRR